VTPRRIVLLVILVLLGGLFVQPLRAYRDSHESLRSARADLERAHADQDRLKRELRALDTRAALVAEAREQGYIFPGETPYAIAGP
jgi:cell division protein FtsB